MSNWVGEGFEKIIAGVALSGMIVLILVLFVAPSKSTGVPEVYQQLTNALTR